MEKERDRKDCNGTQGSQGQAMSGTQSQLVVHTAIMNKFGSANIHGTQELKPSDKTCSGMAASSNSLTGGIWVDPRKRYLRMTHACP